MGYAERVLQPGETIAYRARLHWIIYFAGMLLVAAAAALATPLAPAATESSRSRNTSSTPAPRAEVMNRSLDAGTDRQDRRTR